MGEYAETTQGSVTQEMLATSIAPCRVSLANANHRDAPSAKPVYSGLTFVTGDETYCAAIA